MAMMKISASFPPWDGRPWVNGWNGVELGVGKVQVWGCLAWTKGVCH